MITNKTKLIAAKELSERMRAVNVPNGPINDLPSLFQDDQVRELGMVKDVMDGNEVYKYLRSPIRTEEEGGIVDPTMAPRLG